MTLVLRDIPEDVERALRAKAQAEGKTTEQIAVEALRAITAPSDGPAKKRDLSDLAGTWKEDPEFDRIMREQDQIDPELWK